MDGHLGGVFDVEEVTDLFAVFEIGVIAFEELDFTGLGNLFEGFMDDATHVAFMVFIGAKDVEVFYADDFVEEALFLSEEVE